MSDIRTMIRQILIEELRNYGNVSNQKYRSEVVSVGSSSDLNSFALKVLDIAKSRDLGSDIQSGDFQFVLDNQKSVGAASVNTRNLAGSGSTVFEKSLVSERDVARLTPDITSVVIGKNVCFTPLAKDEIRRRGIKVERKPL